MENKNATAYAIGEHTIVSKQSVMGYLKQNVLPSIKFASALADYLEVDVDWLLNGRDEKMGEGEMLKRSRQEGGSDYKEKYYELKKEYDKLMEENVSLLRENRELHNENKELRLMIESGKNNVASVRSA